MENTTFDFLDGNGPVPAHQHFNGRGWVANTAQVSDTARVSGNALVFGNARVFGNAWVFGNALVSGNARVSGHAKVSGYAQVYGDAGVSGYAKVSGIRRSDGYYFVAVPCADGQNRVIAGCRYFTKEEAYAHWNENHEYCKETRAILQVFEAQGTL
jgi:hypothetical protein